MKILLHPTFVYTLDNYEGYEGINSMSEQNQIVLNPKILSYLGGIFPGEQRDIKRVEGTNYYSINVSNREVDNIETWYKIHLNNAIARGFVEEREWMIQLNIDEALLAADDFMIETNTYELIRPDLDFETEEGRQDVLGYVDHNKDLYQVNIPELFAKKTNFMGLVFDQSKLVNSVFTEAILPMAKFNRCELKGADFQQADLREAEFIRADLAGANFRGANLTGAKFAGSNWQEAINLMDNPTFSSGSHPEQRIAIPAQSLPVSQIAVDIAVPSVLKKLVKTQQKGKLLKDEVWQDENEFNVIDAKNPKK